MVTLGSSPGRSRRSSRRRFSERGPSMSEESIFLTALEKPTPAERTAYLQEACAGIHELRRRVEALLWAHDQSGDLLDPPPLVAQPTVPAGFDPAAGPAS